MKKEYTEQSVIKELGRINELSINTNSKTIYVLKNSTNIGIKTWGKIEYLKKVHGYVQLFTDTINTRNKQIKTKEDETVEIKHSKRDKVNNKDMINNTRINLKGLDKKIKDYVNKLK